jgi:hypothetical protein
MASTQESVARAIRLARQPSGDDCGHSPRLPLDALRHIFADHASRRATLDRGMVLKVLRERIAASTVNLDPPVTPEQ